MINKAKGIFQNNPRMPLYERGQHMRLEIL